MPERIKAFAQLMRLPALFTAWSNIVAAHLLATTGDIDLAFLGWTLLASSALYLSGMILNDCFDVAEDSRERPQRPIPSGRVAPGSAWSLGLSLMVVGLAAAAMAGSTPFIIALVLAAFVLIYDGWLKNSLAGVVVMGGCRYLNWVLGLSAAPLTTISWLIPIPVFLYTVSLTLLSGIEARAQDKGPIIQCMAGLTVTAVIILLLVLAGVFNNLWAVVVLVALTFVVLRHLAALNADTTPQRIQSSMKLLIMGLIPLDAILLLAAGQEIAAALLLLLLVPGYLLAKIIYVT